VAEREKKDIAKRVFVFDTPTSREYLKDYHKLVTDFQFLQLTANSDFESVMMIYDGKISYLTLSEERKLGVIIDDPKLYALHRATFNLLWTRVLTDNPNNTITQDAGMMLNPSFQ
jgi:hypothetical protein